VDRLPRLRGGATSRHYLMTLHWHWPEVEKMLIAINHFNTPTERWHTDPNFRTRVLAERDKDRAVQGKGLYRRLAKLTKSHPCLSLGGANALCCAAVLVDYLCSSIFCDPIVRYVPL
jgi:hypothetical protein